jgi:hypothetical protein
VARSAPSWTRWGEPGWWERYWDDVRPRIVLVRVRSGRFDLRWGMPLWALEESLRFALLALPWLSYGRRRLGAGRERQPTRSSRSARSPGEAPSRPPWGTLLALLEGQGEGLLRLGRGEPFVLVEAAEGDQQVLIEITQY